MKDSVAEAIVSAPVEMREPLVNSQQILTASDWLNRDLPEPDFLCGSWLTTTTRSLLSAATGIGKSNLLLALAASTAAGKPFLHWRERRPARVLFIDGEMSRRLMKQRLADAVRRLGGEVPGGLFVFSREDAEGMAPLNTPEGQAYVDAVIGRIGSVDLVIFDNIMCLLAGDMKDPQHWQAVLDWIRDLTRRSIGQIWVHHAGIDVSRGYGDSSRGWQMDTILHLAKSDRPDADIAFTLSFQKAREKTPETRADFADVGIWLDDNIWRSANRAGPAKKKPPSPKARSFFRALIEALDGHGQRYEGRMAVTNDDWLAACVTLGIVDAAKPKSASAQISKYRAELIDGGEIGHRAGFSWPVA